MGLLQLVLIFRKKRCFCKKPNKTALFGAFAAAQQKNRNRPKA
jgi:hypothetical protein